MELRCQCTIVTVPIPHGSPLSYVVCHCDKCKMTTGSAFHVSAIFPHFDLPQTTLDNLSIVTLPADSGSKSLGYFCKGCGNRLIHTSADDRKTFTICSAGRLVGVDLKEVLERKETANLWTSRAVVPRSMWEGHYMVSETQPDAAMQTELVRELTQAGS